MRKRPGVYLVALSDKYYAPGVGHAAADDSNDFSKTRILAKNETYFSYYLGEF